LVGLVLLLLLLLVTLLVIGRSESVTSKEAASMVVACFHVYLCRAAMPD
jgi:hypothetical protein